MVKGAEELMILDLSFELYDISTSFPHVVPCYGDSSMMGLPIKRNLLNLVFAKRMVDYYKNLFSVILTKTSITSLSIEILGQLPTLVGALGAVARGLIPRTYKLLAIRLRGAFTH